MTIKTCFFVLALLLTGTPVQADDEGTTAAGKDRSQWSNDPKRQQWFKSQTINPVAKDRLKIGYESCCDYGDVFRTRFRLVDDGSKYGAETYEYEKDGKWKVIPADIIQRKPTPDGQPVLFIQKSSGREVCFIIDREGG